MNQGTSPETRKSDWKVPRPPLPTRIVIGKNILGNIQDVVDLSPYTQFVVVADSRLAVSFRLINGLEQTGKPIHLFTVDASESNKTEDQSDKVLAEVLSIKPVIDRKLLICALGGGVIGDMTGYVASRVLRGVDYFQIPTTLLAMVDSSLGGKTAVDYNNITNMIGAFHLPRATVMDVDTLCSLPTRQFTSGLAELVKHGFLDSGLAKFISGTDEKSLRENDDQLIEGLDLSAKYKMSIVEQDFEEKTGVRKVLNFGHTIGRAFETATGLTRFTHGEAVSLGMTAAILISVRAGLLSEQEADGMLGIIKRFNLPTTTSDVDRNLLWEAISADKKSVNGVPRFVLLKGVGKPKIDCIVDRKTVDEVLERVCSVKEELV